MLAFVAQLTGERLEGADWHAPTPGADPVCGLIDYGERRRRVYVQPYAPGRLVVIHVREVADLRYLVSRGGIAWVGGAAWAQSTAADAWPVDRPIPTFSGGHSPRALELDGDDEIVGLEVVDGDLIEHGEPAPVEVGLELQEIG